ncbi:MAG: M20/M25/M40 family metallo-hydrolase [Armatimonadetes bacterium]|nr:M20/M25/M40 family metallo-hydrolase [Armatimonadota bacterium]
MFALPGVQAHIRARADQYLEILRTLIRQPSVSAQGRGMVECAGLVARIMNELGMEARVVLSAGHPVILGERAIPGAQRTLLLTSHYDVQPPEPVEAWSCDPFAAESIGERIIGRGATDAKGNLLAILLAVSVLREMGLLPPVHLKFLFDGEEEIGSPSLPEFLERHRAELAADAVLTVDAGLEPPGRPFVWLGSCGLLAVELAARGGASDLHSSKARLVPNAAWRLVWALSTLKDPHERVAIGGFYAPVRPPGPEERRYLEALLWDDAAQQQALGVTGFLGGVTGLAARERMLYQPTCTITGLISGYAGPGHKEVLPSEARAKVEFRLVPDQSPAQVLSQLRAHLDRHGFGDLEVRELAATEPSQAPLDSAIALAVREAAAEVYGMEPAIRPRHESSGRQGTWIGARLGVPAAITGIGPPGWRGHAPDEFITVEHFLRGIAFVADVIWRYATVAR